MDPLANDPAPLNHEERVEALLTMIGAQIYVLNGAVGHLLHASADSGEGDRMLKLVKGFDGMMVDLFEGTRAAIRQGKASAEARAELEAVFDRTKKPIGFQ